MLLTTIFKLNSFKRDCDGSWHWKLTMILALFLRTCNLFCSQNRKHNNFHGVMLIFEKKSHYTHQKRNSITELTPVRNRHIVVTTWNFFTIYVHVCGHVSNYAAFLYCKVNYFFFAVCCRKQQQFSNWLSALIFFELKVS